VIRNSVWLSINGQPVTEISQGNQFNPGNGLISPLSPELDNLLRNISVALDTLYLQIISFSHDLTLTHISPNTGQATTPSPD
jgi:hypothetical protein